MFLLLDNIPQTESKTSPVNTPTECKTIRCITFNYIFKHFFQQGMPLLQLQ